MAERLRHRLARLTLDQRTKLIKRLPASILNALAYDWYGLNARDNQLPPEWNWFVWLILAGRGYGKTRTGAETIINWAWYGKAPRFGLIAATAADARDTMVEGESGIQTVAPPWFKPKYEPSKRRLTFPPTPHAPSGSVGLLFSADEPERLRGPQFHKLWADELCAWPEPAEKKREKKSNAWDMAMMGLRLGQNPQAVVTTTPKPTPLLLALVKDTERNAITKGNTFENAANLAASYLAHIKRLYQGTRLGKQELFAEILDDAPGALFPRGIWELVRVHVVPALVRIIVSVDPAPTSHSGSDETGIIVMGLGYDDKIYILEDCSLRAPPDQWARAVIKAYYKWHADRVVAETNNGGEMVEMTLRTIDPNVSYKHVLARRGKFKRAEPVGATYEQQRIVPVGHHDKLEDQSSRFTGVNGIRDDRTDAMCHGVHELLNLNGDGFAFV